MASIFGHIAIVLGGKQLVPKTNMSTKIVLLGIISSVLPDIDILAFQFGILDPSPLGHRGLTHSIPFAFLWSLLLTVILHKGEKKNRLFLILFYTLCMASHGLIDGCTNGGAGIAYFYPFSSERYFMPYRFIEVSPLGISSFFSKWGVEVLLNELITLMLPSLLIYLLGVALNKYIYR